MIAGVLIPGGNYGTQAPLLAYAAMAFRRREVPTHHVSWQPPRGLDPFALADFVRVHVVAALATLEAEVPGATPVLVGKSLGTLAASLAAERGLPAEDFLARLSGATEAGPAARGSGLPTGR